MPNVASLPQCVQVLGYRTVSPGTMVATGWAVGSRYPERTVSFVDSTVCVVMRSLSRAVAADVISHAADAKIGCVRHGQTARGRCARARWDRDSAMPGAVFRWPAGRARGIDRRAHRGAR